MPPQLRRPLLRVEDFGEVTLVRVLVKELGEEEIQAIGGELSAIADGLDHGQLTLDLGQVRFLTSTALGTFMALHRRLGDRGGQLVLANVTDIVYEVFEVTCLNHVLDIRR